MGDTATEIALKTGHAPTKEQLDYVDACAGIIASWLLGDVWQRLPRHFTPHYDRLPHHATARYDDSIVAAWSMIEACIAHFWPHIVVQRQPLFWWIRSKRAQEAHAERVKKFARHLTGGARQRQK